MRYLQCAVLPEFAEEDLPAWPPLWAWTLGSLRFPPPAAAAEWGMGNMPGGAGEWPMGGNMGGIP